MQLTSALSIFALAALTFALDQSVDSVGSVGSVDIPCGAGFPWKQTAKADNPNPHQNFIYKQISGTTDCDENPEGTAAISTGLSVGWTASVGFKIDFINGGFSVSRATSTGSTNGFSCKKDKGRHSGDLCVFERIQTTAFTVKQRTCTSSSCGGTRCGAYSPAGVLTAPNAVQGDCYYNNFQLKLPCGVKGSEHHVPRGPAGGPQFIDCHWLP